jgi:hypothetical protein
VRNIPCTTSSARPVNTVGDDDAGGNEIAGSSANTASSSNPPVIGKEQDKASEDVKADFLRSLICQFDKLVLNFLDKSSREAV